MPLTSPKLMELLEKKTILINIQQENINAKKLKKKEKVHTTGATEEDSISV